jgi:hypothetical protein
MRIRIQLFTSVQIRIQRAKPMRIQIQILVRLCRHQKLILHEKLYFMLMLRIRDVYPGSFFSIPDPRSELGSRIGSRIPEPGVQKQEKRGGVKICYIFL